MGSKMSFSRGSSEKNTNSALTSVATHPRGSVHVPSDCKQVPEDKICCEEDVDSRWREEKKATERTQAAAASHSFGHMESDCHVNSETVGGTDCQHSEPHIGMEAKSQMTSASMCSSTTDSHGEPVEVSKRHEHPRKRKPLVTADEKDPESVGVDAVQHKEISTTLPLPTCIESHNNNDKMPNAIDSPVVNDLPHNDVSDPRTLSDCKVEDGVPVLPKRRRGRPKKREIIPPVSPALSADVSIGGPAQRLRSREAQPLTRDGKTESESKEDPKQTEKTLTESGNTMNFQVNKRRRAKLVCQSVTDQQVPAKVSRLDVSQEASSVLRNDPDSGERAETDKQVERNTDKQVTDTDGMSDRLAPQSGDGPEEQIEQKQAALLQSEIHSQQAAEPERAPSEGLNSLNLERPTQSDNPKITQSTDKNAGEEAQSKNCLETPKDAISQNTEAACTEAVTSSEQPPVEVLPAIKTESIEIELGRVNHVSESNTSLQYDGNVTVRPGGSNGEQNFFRRKKGGKRRRRKSNTLLPRAKPSEAPEGNNDTRQKNDCGDVDNVGSSNDDINAVYTKRGGKTVLKCGHCGLTCKYMSQFIIHKRVHTGERPFKCSDCGKGFSKNSNLNLHLKTHQKNNSYRKCPVCKLNFCCAEYASHVKMHALVPGRNSDSNKSEKRHEANEVEKSPAVSTPKCPEERESKVCQYCGKTFRFPSALIRHVRVHTGEKPYKCDICGKAFGQAYFLRVHELTHWSVKRYNCTRCEKSFAHYSNARSHRCRPPERDKGLQLKRRIKPSLTYTCHICKDVLNSLQDFNDHMKDHSGTKLYRCVHCDKLFGFLSEFSSHRTQCPQGSAASVSEIKEEETVSSIPYSVPAPRCSSGQNSAAPITAANSERRQKTSLTGHKKRSANLKKPFQSTDVPAHPLSHFVSKLNQLDNRSDPRQYLCPSCGRLFRHMGRLRAHMLTHAPGQSYTCTCCGKTLENWKKLWHHQRIHRQRRGRFTCPRCGQGFRFVEPYKKHMSEHPEFHWIQVRPRKVPLPYQCEQCRCSFKTLDMLFSHQLCHSSTQDMLKDTDLDLSMDEHSAPSSTKTFSPPMNNHTVTLHPEHKSPLSPVSKYPGSALQESPLTTQISFVQNEGLDSNKTLHRPGDAHSIQDGEDTLDRLDKKCLGKPSAPLRTVERRGTQNASMSNAGSSDGVTCTICGKAYPAISDLYHHYLQHARGEAF